MPSMIRKWEMLFGLALVMGACGTVDGKSKKQAGAEQLAAPATKSATAPTPENTSKPTMVADSPVKIGKPYEVGGITYTPEDPVKYDEVGYASWYGEEVGAASTANGERFNPSGISAAHRTLPLPSYVEITSLENGRTILVRVNDRGPYSSTRLIDISRGAAEQLGMKGSTPVRVRRVNPPEQERAVLRSGGRAAERLETPAPLLAVLRKNLAERVGSASVLKPTEVIAPTPPVPVPVPAKVETPPPPNPGKGYIVQIGAFSGQDRANSAAKRLDARAERSGTLWRVRSGPYPDLDAAKKGVARAAAAGFNDARIMVNE